MKHRSLLTIAGLPVLAALTFAAASCGGGGGSSSSDTIPAGATVVRAEPGLRLDQASYTATAVNGTVTIAYVQDDTMRHTLVVQDSSGVAIGTKLEVVKKGAQAVGTFQLAPGTYTVHCDVPGHSAMKATLVVT